MILLKIPLPPLTSFFPIDSARASNILRWSSVSDVGTLIVGSDNLAAALVAAEVGDALVLEREPVARLSSGRDSKLLFALQGRDLSPSHPSVACVMSRGSE